MSRASTTSVSGGLDGFLVVALIIFSVIASVCLFLLGHFFGTATAGWVGFGLSFFLLMLAIAQLLDGVYDEASVDLLFGALSAGVAAFAFSKAGGNYHVAVVVMLLMTAALLGLGVRNARTKYPSTV
jgi:hypothetical protein